MQPGQVGVIGGGDRRRREWGADGDQPPGSASATIPALEVVIHEASGIVGRGIAYGNDDQRHLLNVRAGVSAPSRTSCSEIFLDWALRTGRSSDPQAIPLVRTDAIYLQERLADVAQDRSVCGGCSVAEPMETGFDKIVTERSRSHASAVVLAHGNQPPRLLVASGTGERFRHAPWHVANPVELARLRALPADASVVVVDTGLTAVDTVITLLEDGPDREVTMLSRHGLLPKPHVGQAHTAWVTKVPEGPGPVTADEIAAAVTEECAAAAERGVGWRAVVDGLRPATQDLAPAAARGAGPLPRGLRPRLGGAPPPDGARRRPAPAALPLPGPPRCPRGQHRHGGGRRALSPDERHRRDVDDRRRDRQLHRTPVRRPTERGPVAPGARRQPLARRARARPRHDRRRAGGRCLRQPGPGPPPRRPAAQGHPGGVDRHPRDPRPGRAGRDRRGGAHVSPGRRDARNPCHPAGTLEPGRRSFRRLGPG